MRYAAIAVFAGLLAAPTSGFAQTAWFELEVPGSVENIPGAEDSRTVGPRVLRELVGVFHDRGPMVANEEAWALFACLADLHRLLTHWRAVERAAGRVSLPTATGNRDVRRVLERFLELFDLELTRRDSSYRVRTRGREPERRICGGDFVWPPDEVERRLNAGETLVLDLPHFVVSLPLSARFWLELLYDEQVDTEAQAAALAAGMAADLVGWLLANPRAAQLYLGLSALDDRTLIWLHEHPRVLLQLDDERLSTFARFAGSLRVHDGEVRVPGGAEAVSFWERLVDASPSDPERFVERLFARSSGRVAQAYHMVSRLPERQQRFVLGSWRADERNRRRGVAELQNVLNDLPPPDRVFANPGAAPMVDVDATARRIPGQSICGVPPDEAIALTWDFGVMRSMATTNVGAVSAFACSPLQCTTSGRANELFALEAAGVDITREGFRFACRLRARMQFLSEAARAALGLNSAIEAMQISLPARMYRLGYRLGRDVPNMLELREFIDH